MTSINIDWMNEFKERFENWENETQIVLRQILEDEENPKFKEVAECLEVLDDEGKLNDYWEESLNAYEPLMNYGHILETEPDNEKILEVALKTNCSVMYDTEKEQYYIVLNGGGMDLSQDIGLSYMILENWIPEDLIGEISKQKGLSISKEDFEVLKEAIIKQTETYENRFKQIGEDWRKTK